MGSDMGGFSKLSGKEFETQWVSQMLTMHENKLNELTQASQSVQDPKLRESITKAIPLIKAHRDALTVLKTRGTNQ